jgi:hypothetical protein
MEIAVTILKYVLALVAVYLFPQLGIALEGKFFGSRKIVDVVGKKENSPEGKLKWLAAAFFNSQSDFMGSVFKISARPIPACGASTNRTWHLLA